MKKNLLVYGISMKLQDSHMIPLTKVCKASTANAQCVRVIWTVKHLALNKDSIRAG